MTHTKTLIGAGLMTNTPGCSIITITFQTFPELLGKTQSSLDTCHLYIPDKTLVAAAYEVQALEEIKPAEVVHLDDIISQVKMRQ
jgi:hypothetical protein